MYKLKQKQGYERALRKRNAYAYVAWVHAIMARRVLRVRMNRI
jgi:hypothetical protein